MHLKHEFIMHSYDGSSPTEWPFPNRSVVRLDLQPRGYMTSCPADLGIARP